MTPSLRRAFHQALDIVLDALSEDERAANANHTPRKRRPLAKPLPPLPPDVTPEELAASEERLARAGYRKAG